MGAMPPFIPKPPPWELWSPERTRYTVVDLAALFELCGQRHLHTTNMQVLVGHKRGNTSGAQGGKAHEGGWVCFTENDVKWLQSPAGEVLPTCGPVRGKGGGQLFLDTVAATTVPQMPFASVEMFLKLLHRRMHKGKLVTELFGWRVVPKPADAEALWPHIVMTVCKPSCSCGCPFRVA